MRRPRKKPVRRQSVGPVGGRRAGRGSFTGSGFAEARTTYGKIGCKVWIFRGEVLPEGAAAEKVSPRAARPAGTRSSAATPTPVQ